MGNRTFVVLLGKEFGQVVVEANSAGVTVHIEMDAPAGERRQGRDLRRLPRANRPSDAVGRDYTDPIM